MVLQIYRDNVVFHEVFCNCCKNDERENAVFCSTTILIFLVIVNNKILNHYVMSSLGIVQPFSFCFCLFVSNYSRVFWVFFIYKIITLVFQKDFVLC